MAGFLDFLQGKDKISTDKHQRKKTKNQESDTERLLENKDSERTTRLTNSPRNAILPYTPPVNISNYDKQLLSKAMTGEYQYRKIISIQDVESLIKEVRRKISCIADFRESKEAQRQLDYMSGAFFVLKVEIEKLRDGVYIITPLKRKD